MVVLRHIQLYFSYILRFRIWEMFKICPQKGMFSLLKRTEKHFHLLFDIYHC